MEAVFGRVEYVAVTFRIEGRETRVKEYKRVKERNGGIQGKGEYVVQ